MSDLGDKIGGAIVAVGIAVLVAFILSVTALYLLFTCGLC